MKIILNVPDNFNEIIAKGNGWTGTTTDTTAKEVIVQNEQEGEAKLIELQEQGHLFLKADKNPDGTHTILYQEVTKIKVPADYFSKELVKGLAMEKYSEASAKLAAEPLLKKAQEEAKKAEEEAVKSDITVE